MPFPKILEFLPPEFSSLPKKMNRFFDQNKNDFVIVCAKGTSLDEYTVFWYRELMTNLKLGFSFYPYHQMMPEANVVLGTPNPIAVVNCPEKNYCYDLIRYPNFGCMFFDTSKLFDVRVREDLTSAFMEVFIDDLASVCSIPSNGAFVDEHESWRFFWPYDGEILSVSKRNFNKELSESEIILDNDIDKVIEYIKREENKK